MKKRRVGLLSFSVLLLLGFSTGCLGLNQSFCDHQYPDIKKEIQEKMHNLKELTVRLPASVDSSPIQGQEKRWKNWSLSQLDHAQKYIDMIPPRSSKKKLRSDLSYIAMLWIDFYGYSQEGKVNKMITVLEQIQDRQEEAYRSICSESF